MKNKITDERARIFVSCLGNGSGSEEQAYADDTPDEINEDWEQSNNE